MSCKTTQLSHVTDFNSARRAGGKFTVASHRHTGEVKRGQTLAISKQANESHSLQRYSK